MLILSVFSWILIKLLILRFGFIFGQVGDQIKAVVIKLDKERKRISLSLKPSHFEGDADDTPTKMKQKKSQKKKKKQKQKQPKKEVPFPSSFIEQTPNTACLRMRMPWT